MKIQHRLIRKLCLSLIGIAFALPAYATKYESDSGFGTNSPALTYLTDPGIAVMIPFTGVFGYYISGGDVGAHFAGTYQWDCNLDGKYLTTGLKSYDVTTTSTKRAFSWVGNLQGTTGGIILNDHGDTVNLLATATAVATVNEHSGADMNSIATRAVQVMLNFD